MRNIIRNINVSDVKDLALLLELGKKKIEICVFRKMNNGGYASCVIRV